MLDRLSFQVLSGDNPGRRIHVQSPRIEFGRSSRSIALNDSRVSRRHAVVELSHGHWWVRDLGSQHGTQLNGEPIFKPVRLGDGDELRLGRVLLAVRLEQGPATTVPDAQPRPADRSEGREPAIPSAPSPSRRPQPGATSGSAGAGPRLKLQGRCRSRRHGIERRRVLIAESDELIGRAAPHLRLYHASVARCHVRVWPQGEHWYIEDLGSSWGTTVNDVPLDAPRPLREGDHVAIGRVRLTVEQALPATAFATTDAPAPPGWRRRLHTAPAIDRADDAAERSEKPDPPMPRIEVPADVDATTSPEARTGADDAPSSGAPGVEEPRHDKAGEPAAASDVSVQDCGAVEMPASPDNRVAYEPSPRAAGDPDPDEWADDAAGQERDDQQPSLFEDVMPDPEAQGGDHDAPRPAEDDASRHDIQSHDAPADTSDAALPASAQDSDQASSMSDSDVSIRWREARARGGDAHGAADAEARSGEPSSSSSRGPEHSAVRDAAASIESARALMHKDPPPEDANPVTSLVPRSMSSLTNSRDPLLQNMNAVFPHMADYGNGRHPARPMHPFDPRRARHRGYHHRSFLKRILDNLLR